MKIRVPSVALRFPLGRSGLLALWVLVVLAMAAAVAHGQATGTISEERVAELVQSLDGVVRQPTVDSAWVGVRVETVDGRVLYDFNGAKLMMPASNMKLITAAAGLELLGPDHVWETRVWLDPWESAGGSEHLTGPLPERLEGNIYLQGGGDPTLLQEDLERLARLLHARGLRHIAGDVVYDASFFDDQLRGPGWSWDYLDAYYAAPVSGLALSPDRDYDANTVKVSVYPAGALFEPGLVVISPSLAGIRVVNETRTAGAASTGSISAYWADDGSLVVSGSTPLGRGPTTMWIAMQDPAPLVATVFANALRQAGIEVAGDVVPGRVSRELVHVAGHTSMPLSQLLVPFLKLSNNGHGEVILKTLGRKFRSQGSWAAGRAVIESFLRDVVRVPGSFNISDGSGLGRTNLVTPQQLIAVLRYMADRPNFPYFYHALPVAGASDRMVGGTLRSRLQGTPAQFNARAKTGSIGNVSTLSGYVDNATGERLVFSIMFNHALGVPSTTYQDVIVTVLARWSSE